MKISDGRSYIKFDLENVQKVYTLHDWDNREMEKQFVEGLRAFEKNYQDCLQNMNVNEGDSLLIRKNRKRHDTNIAMRFTLQRLNNA